jgi:hypothetical protein
VLVVEAGQHADRGGAVGAQDRAQPVQPVAARHVEVEQHAVALAQQTTIEHLQDRLRDDERELRVDLREQLPHQERVSGVVLDQQDATQRRRGRGPGQAGR